MGTLRDLRRGDRHKAEADAKKAALFPWLQDLRGRQGKGWDEIEGILRQEGYEEHGKSLTANALRKRYAKWSKSESSSAPTSESEPAQTQERRESSLGRFEGTATLPAPVSENVIASSIAGLAALSNQLLEQVQQSNRMIERLERRLKEQEPRSSHTGIDDTEKPVRARDLIELLKEITTRRQQMHFIEEHQEDYVQREEIHQLLEESVQEKVDAELKTMLTEDGRFAERLVRLIDQRLMALFLPSEPVVSASQAGPGRGKKGKTHKKFSASLEQGLFERVKALPGQFSGHLANALNAYLAVMEEKTSE